MPHARSAVAMHISRAHARRVSGKGFGCDGAVDKAMRDRYIAADDDDWLSAWMMSSAGPRSKMAVAARA